MKKSSDVFVFDKDIAATSTGEGVTRKILGYCENMMVCKIRLEKGAVVPNHTHPHEQCTTVVFGKLAYTVGKETKVVQDGDSVMIGENVPHALTALEESLVFDIFTPMREDFV